MYHYYSRRFYFGFAIGFLLYFQVFFLSSAMSFRADTSRATSLPSALEHALAAEDEIVVGGFASSMIPCNIHEVSDRFHDYDEPDNGSNSLFHQQECLEGIQNLRPTALDSDTQKRISLPEKFLRGVFQSPSAVVNSKTRQYRSDRF